MYERTEDRYNEEYQVASGVTSIAKNPVPEFPGVDIVMTHGLPKRILNQCLEHAGCENLLRASRTVRPRMHFSGSESEEGMMSQQEEKELAYPPYESDIPHMFPEPIQLSIVHGRQSLMINATIMDHIHRLRNAPWLVDLELPRIMTFPKSKA